MKITDLPNRTKEDFIPPLNAQITIGNCLFRVTHRNVGKLRFTLTFVGVREKSRILKPTGMPLGDPRCILSPGVGY